MGCFTVQQRGSCGSPHARCVPIPSAITSSSKGAVSSGISTISSRDLGPTEGLNPAQGREERPRPSLPIPVFGGSADDSPHPGGAVVSVVLPEGQDLGDCDPHQSPLVILHAEAAGLCLD